MKKRVIALTMAALMAASLTACGGSAKETTAAAAAKEESTAVSYRITCNNGNQRTLINP